MLCNDYETSTYGEGSCLFEGTHALNYMSLYEHKESSSYKSEDTEPTMYTCVVLNTCINF